MKKISMLLLGVLLCIVLSACAEETDKTTIFDTSAMGRFDKIIEYVVKEETYNGEGQFPTLQEIRQMYSGRIFSMDDFSLLEPGVSTSSDIDNLTPYYLCTPYAVGDVYQYPAADGNYIYIVCTGRVEAIFMTDSSQFVGSVEFSSMMKDPSLRPPVGRWK
ncbi:MAG: hypothetical protein ACI4IN_00120 [Eubacterium sp.]